MVRKKLEQKRPPKQVRAFYSTLLSLHNSIKKKKSRDDEDESYMSDTSCNSFGPFNIEQGDAVDFEEDYASLIFDNVDLLLEKR